MGTLRLPDGETEAGPWRAMSLMALLQDVRSRAGVGSSGRCIVAIDGRGAAGKSTLAERLQRLVRSSAVVHTDDLAWHEPLFAWGHLLEQEVLRPLRAGEPVRFRPPQWRERGRPGAIEVPVGTDLVLVEGTGASHREHEHLIDVTVWVQADVGLAQERGIARDIAQGVNGDAAAATAFWHDWMTEELAFFARQRPWERAAVVVNGTPGRDLAIDEVLVAHPPR